jgi:hypothetical protein
MVSPTGLSPLASLPVIEALGAPRRHIRRGGTGPLVPAKSGAPYRSLNSPAPVKSVVHSPSQSEGKDSGL